MASIKKTLWQAVKARIEDQVSSINEVSIFNNQFDREKEEDPTNYPCVFYEFLNIEWQLVRQQYDNSNQTQSQVGLMQFRLHIAPTGLSITLNANSIRVLPQVQLDHVAFLSMQRGIGSRTISRFGIYFLEF